MALDFPASPTNGQVYQNWTWNSTKGVWQATPLLPIETVISSTAPSNPLVGNKWWLNDDGSEFISYNDGTSTQWVESRNSAAFLNSSTLTALASRVTNLETKTNNSVIQVAQTVYNGEQSGSVGSLTYTNITGLAATITPRFASSQILVMLWVQGSGTYDITVRMLRNGTVVGAGTGSTSQNGTTFLGMRGNTYEGFAGGGTFLDAPATTSALTYQAQVSCNGSYFINRSQDQATGERTISSITLLEIAGA